MTRTSSNRINIEKPQPVGKLELDTYLIDEEFDDFLDRDFLAYRDLADLRNF